MGKNKKSISLVILFACLIIFELLVCFRNNYYDSKVSYAMGNTKEIVSIEPTLSVAEESKFKIDALREKYGNDEVIGILKIDGTSIDEPIMKHSDNDYYLSHNKYGDYQAEGSVYADYRVSLVDRKILIFGHSSPNWNVPFNDLEKYYEKEFYDNHKYIEITHENGINIYEIFSVHIETGDWSYMKVHMDSDTYNGYLKKYQDKSFYETTAKVNDNDEILILQTCSNKKEYQGYSKKFLLVVAKKIREVK